MKTNWLAGYKLPLRRGVRYIASTLENEGQHATVIISELETGHEHWRIKDIERNEANSFLAEFNNDPKGSIHGRAW